MKKKQIKSYKQLSVEERERIQELLWQKQSIRYIATELERSPATISREIKRNNPKSKKRYTPRLANERAVQKRSSRGREERLKSEALRIYVVNKLKLGWSPEQIAGKSKKVVGISISYEAIYQYIYHQIYRNGHGYVKPGCEDLRPYLARRRKRRMKKGSRKVQKQERFDRLPSIESRPKEAEKRKKVGHWEDDLIVSKHNTQALKTINERVSGLVLIGRVYDHTMAETNRVVTKRLSQIPHPYRKTLTRDRGKENLGYKELEETLNINCYFADPYQSWKRGSNENLNGLIRRYFPKKTNFATLSDEDIHLVEHLLNSRPRKRLGWKTPYEVFNNLTGVALKDWMYLNIGWHFANFILL